MKYTNYGKQSYEFHTGYKVVVGTNVVKKDIKNIINPETGKIDVKAIDIAKKIQANKRKVFSETIKDMKLRLNKMESVRIIPTGTLQVKAWNILQDGKEVAWNFPSKDLALAQVEKIKETCLKLKVNYKIEPKQRIKTSFNKDEKEFIEEYFANDIVCIKSESLAKQVRTHIGIAIEDQDPIRQALKECDDKEVPMKTGAKPRYECKSQSFLEIVDHMLNVNQDSLKTISNFIRSQHKVSKRKADNLLHMIRCGREIHTKYHYVS